MTKADTGDDRSIGVAPPPGLEALLADLTARLGAGAVLVGPEVAERVEAAGPRLGAPYAILRPSSPEEVALILRSASRAGISIVPWGGGTGLVHGAVADAALALSLERMNRIEAIDPVEQTLTVQAGCILQTACEAAEAQNLMLAIDLGSRGSATIGGVIATNAGGNRVIRFGMTRDLVLGLEVVLADGTIVSSLNSLIKNNAGYDVKQLFIGSEGTLGVVTRAVLRLRPRPATQDTAFVAFERFDQMTRFLRRMEAALGGTLSAFEAMWADFYDLVTTPPALGRAPLPAGFPYYVLVESLGGDPLGDTTRFEAALSAAAEAGEISDAVVAKNQSERDAMWALRDDVRQTARNWPIFTFDVSLPIGEMSAYVQQVQTALKDRWAARATLAVFGHIGDGNLHLIAGVGSQSSEDRRAVESIVYGALDPRSGSISAEHGIGLEKKAYLHLSRNPEEIALMRRLKAALDPNGVLNPGKVLPDPPADGAVA